MKKKVLLFSLTLALLASLVIVGCGGTETPTGPGAPQQPQQPQQPTGGPSDGEPGKVIRLKFADWDPAVSVFCRNFRDAWALAIEAQTDGRVVMDVYGSETLVKSADLHDALLTGIADVVLESPTFMPGQYPLTEIGHLPFMFRSSLIAGLSMLEAFEGGYFQDEWQDAVLVSFRPNDVYNICNRTKEIRTLEDWKGMKVAARGITDTEMIKLLGGTPVSLSSAERYDALAKGMIDQANLEWEGHYIWRHYEVTKYRTDGCDMMVGAGTNHAMAFDSYNSLPADVQAMFDAWIGTYLTELTSSNMDRENEWRRVLIKEHDQKVGNPEFYVLPADERARWEAKMTEMYDAYLDPLEARGLPARACFDKLKELSAKYEAMYPPKGEAHMQKMLDYGFEALHPGWPQTHPEGFEWLYEATGKDNVSSPSKHAF